ncbi:MAG: hypothetical protein HQM08_26030 [Candidatus Riflebacteria bacterium]|nr:hypothetical protein [Candidatus Riflebacteria bacterium]
MGRSLVSAYVDTSRERPILHSSAFGSLRFRKNHFPGKKYAALTKYSFQFRMNPEALNMVD